MKKLALRETIDLINALKPLEEKLGVRIEKSLNGICLVANNNKKVSKLMQESLEEHHAYINADFAGRARMLGIKGGDE